MDIPTLLGVVVAALAILGAAGSAWAFLADRGNKDRLVGLRQDITDRNARIDFLEEKGARDEERAQQQSTTIAQLQTEVATLTGYVEATAGPTKILLDLLQAHHDFTAKAMSGIERQNEATLALLRGTSRGTARGD